MFENSIFELNDFSGGISDLDIEVTGTLKEAHNLVITDDKRLETRWAYISCYEVLSELLEEFFLDHLNEKIISFLQFKNKPIIFTTNHILYEQNNYLEIIKIPAISITKKDSGMNYSTSTNQIIVTNLDYSYPHRIYQDDPASEIRFEMVGAPLFNDTRIEFHNIAAKGSISFLYAFVYINKFNIDGSLQIERGQPIYKRVKTARHINDKHQVTIDNIHQFRNTDGRNYNLNNIKLEIYRTPANQNSLQLLTTIDLNESSRYVSFIDNIDDQNLGRFMPQSPEIIKEIPSCKYCCVIGNIAFYGNHQSFHFKNRISFSKPFQLGIILATNFIDLPSPIKGIKSLGQRFLIIFTESAIYRIDITTSRYVPVLLHDEKIYSIHSAIEISNQLFYATESGIFSTDGFQYKRLSALINDRYLEIISSKTHSMWASYDKLRKSVAWNFKENQSEVMALALDLKFQSPAFTTFNDPKENDFHIHDIDLGLISVSNDHTIYCRTNSEYRDYLDSEGETPILFSLKTNQSYLGYTGKKVVPYMTIETKTLEDIDLVIKSTNNGQSTQGEERNFNFKKKDSLQSDFITQKINFKYNQLRLIFKQIEVSSLPGKSQKIKFISFTFKYQPISQYGNLPVKEVNNDVTRSS